MGAIVWREYLIRALMKKRCFICIVAHILLLFLKCSAAVFLFSPADGGRMSVHIV